jgi:hypothetical protein
MKSSNLHFDSTVLTLVLFITSIIFSGCSNPFGGTGGSYVDQTYGRRDPAASLPAPSGFGAISGSNQGGTTALGRKIEISVGSPTSKMRLETSRNRTVFMSVQGQMISK